MLVVNSCTIDLYRAEGEDMTQNGDTQLFTFTVIMSTTWLGNLQNDLGSLIL